MSQPEPSQPEPSQPELAEVLFDNKITFFAKPTFKTRVILKTASIIRSVIGRTSS